MQTVCLLLLKQWGILLYFERVFTQHLDDSVQHFNRPTNVCLFAWLWLEYVLPPSHELDYLIFLAALLCENLWLIEHRNHLLTHSTFGNLGIISMKGCKLSVFMVCIFALYPSTIVPRYAQFTLMLNAFSCSMCRKSSHVNSHWVNLYMGNVVLIRWIQMCEQCSDRIWGVNLGHWYRMQNGTKCSCQDFAK